MAAHAASYLLSIPDMIDTASGFTELGLYLANSLPHYLVKIGLQSHRGCGFLYLISKSRCTSLIDVLSDLPFAFFRRQPNCPGSFQRPQYGSSPGRPKLIASY